MNIRKIKNKKFIILTIFIFCFFISNKSTFAATLNFNPNSGKYTVGDTIKIRAVVNSDASINAVSAKVLFPTNNLTLQSISKNFSIIDLWVKDPSFSNETGTASFEGVILNGFTGSSGSIVTFVFKAKSVGSAELKFSGASILANDGNGTELIKGSNSSVITIEKAIEKVEKKPVVPVEKPSVVKEIVDTSKEAFTEVRQIEQTNNLPNYSLVILLSLIIILILILIVMYGIYYINKIKKYFKKKLIMTEEDVSSKFKVLENDIDKEIIISRKIQENEKLTEDEMSSLVNFKKDIESTEDTILGDIKDIEKNS